MNIAIVFVFAVVTEALVNLIFEDSQGKAKKYVAYAVGIMFTVVWRVGILASLGVPVPNVIAAYIDYVTTGIFCSRGSNYLHDLVTAIKAYTDSKTAS